MSIMSFRKFPNILWSDVNFFWPNDCSVTNEHLIEEGRIVQPLPIRHIEIACAVKNAFFPVVELDIEFVVGQWLHRNYIVNDFHFVLYYTKKPPREERLLGIMQAFYECKRTTRFCRVSDTRVVCGLGKVDSRDICYL